jgi:hypothetical protein
MPEVMESSFTPGGAISAVGVFLDNIRVNNHSSSGVAFQSYGAPVRTVLNKSFVTACRGDANSAGVRTDGNAFAPTLLSDAAIFDNSIRLMKGYSPGELLLQRSTLTSSAKATNVLATGLIITFGNNVIRGNADDALGALSPGALH